MTSAQKKDPHLPPFRPFSYFIKSFFRLCLGTGLFILFLLFIGYYWLNETLPSLKGFDARVRTPCVTIQAFDGTTLATYGDSFEEFLTTEDLPPYVPNTFLSVEDRRFYEHSGVDLIGILRAAVRNLYARKVVQGGSTLTQQLAKNMLMASGYFPVSDRSLMRKLQELVLSLKLEAYFSKSEILTLYLNRVYFGAGTYGIDAASRRYFRKSGKELTLFEAAILAGLLRAPSRYSPLANPQRACERAHHVLTAMENVGFIGPEWRKDWEIWKASFFAWVKDTEKGSRYFTDWVFESLPALLGPIDQDLTVVTTLRSDFQHQVEDTLRQFHAENSQEYKFSQAASVVMTASGAILAMVGGLDYGKSQFNRVTSAKRQPGSSFKTFVYLSGLEDGIELDDLFDDSAFEQGTWKPGNYKWKSLGEISYLESFVYSVNSVCIRVAKQVGVRHVMRTARRLGITSPLEPNLTLALGSSSLTLLELVRAYAPFFNYGYSCRPYGIYEVRNKVGDILYQRTDDNAVPVVQEEPLEKMKIMLRTVIARGTGRAANVDPRIGGKTGSNGNRDAWFVGGLEPQPLEPEEDETSLYTQVLQNGIVLGVWIGNDSLDQGMAPHSTGGRIPTRMAAKIFKILLTKPAPQERPQDEDDEGEKDQTPNSSPSGKASSVGQYLQSKEGLQREMAELDGNSDSDEDASSVDEDKEKSLADKASEEEEALWELFNQPALDIPSVVVEKEIRRSDNESPEITEYH